MVKLSRAQENDLGDVQAFVHDHWKKDHILSRDLALLTWQYADPDHGGYNIVLARREGELLGILGYVRSQQFERIDLTFPTVWLALWNVRDDIRIPGLGLSLLRFVTQHEDPALFAIVGINDAANAIYQRLGYLTGELDHHIFINSRRSNFRIFAPGNQSIPGRTFAKAESIRPFAEQPADILPRKTRSYFENRYASHPYYEYRIVPVDRGLVVVRRVEALGSCALRIIDAVGPDEMWAAIGPHLEALVLEHNAEYVDLLSMGVPSATLARSGFLDRRQFPEWIVPNYFEPFAAKNAAVRWAAKIPAGLRYVAFKGDGDQDRPNWLVK